MICNFMVSRVFSVAKNFMEATEVEAIVAKNLYAVSRADKQKMLRYWTEYASLCAFIVGPISH